MLGRFQDERFWQRNPVWETYPLGTAENSTIGKYGCLMCSVARMLWLADPQHRYITPYRLDKWLVAHNGYVNGNDLVYAAVDGLNIVRFENLLNLGGALTAEQVDQLAGHLTQGKYVLLKVDFHPFAPPGIQQHWVLLEKVEQDDRFPFGRLFWAYDPWTGAMVDVAGRYAPFGRDLDYAVWGAAIYRPV